MNPNHSLWQNLVAATADLGPEATAMRIPLFVEYRQPPRSLSKSIGATVKTCAQFLACPRKVTEHSAINGALFCFPHRTSSNVNNLLPVAREALRRGLLGGILTAEDLSVELHEFVGAVPIVSAVDFLGQLGVRDRVRYVAHVMDKYVQITAALSRQIQGFQLARRRASVVRDLVGSVLYGSVCERLLDSWLPTCVISTSDFWPLEHQLCCQASRRQIPSLVIQHGAIDDIWWPFVADLYCLWGGVHADQMCHLGAPPDRLKVFGMPATDGLFRRVRIAQARPVRDRAQPVCLILSQTQGTVAEPEVFRRNREFLSEATKLTPFITWKVKLHPVENDSFYQIGRAHV